ncbi:MAG TPA: type I-D CRISPR-associated helicase Cas3' [Candidatus Methylomirabilis sp.]|nr:type I-D CRISPR-associated helicase Cas3' [Candidatus Methylomirabilis sp.]
MEKSYIFKPQNIEFTDTMFDRKQLHATQKAMLEMGEMKEDCLLIHAPTGSGKTYGFGLPSLRYDNERLFDGSLPKTIIIAPTNALIYQTEYDLKKDWKHKKLKVEILFAKNIVANGWNRALEIYERIRDADIIITNPDITTLLLSNYYYRDEDPNKIRLRQWSDLFKNTRFMIFDEYHLYSEDEIGKVISFLIMSKATRNNLKTCFSSATPNNLIKKVLEEKYSLKCKEVTQELVEEESRDMKYRKVKGELKVTFTDKNISDSLNDVIHDKRRTLYIFRDLKTNLEAQEELYKSDIAFGSFTGLDTKRGQKEVPDDRIILATNKAELGLNLDIKLAHIEPGFYAENFWQRFGRFARKGEDGEIVVHINSDIIKNLPVDIKNYKEFVECMDKVLIDKKMYSSKIINHVGAYLYLVKIRSNRILADQIQSAMSNLQGENMYKAFEKAEILLREINQISEKNQIVDPYIIESIDNWWHRYFLPAFGRFRGQSLDVLYSSHVSSQEEPVEYGLKWIKANCILGEFGNLNGRRVYKSKGFHDTRRTLELQYSSPSGCDFIITDKSLHENNAHQDVWKKQFFNLLENTEDDEELNCKMREFVDLFNSKIIWCIHKDFLAPKGVDVIDNFI